MLIQTSPSFHSLQLCLHSLGTRDILKTVSQFFQEHANIPQLLSILLVEVGCSHGGLPFQIHHSIDHCPLVGIVMGIALYAIVWLRKNAN